MPDGKGTAQYLWNDVGVALSCQSTECGLDRVMCCSSIDPEDVVVAPLAHPTGSAHENCPLAAPEASASKARVHLVSWKVLSSAKRPRQIRAFLVLISLRFALISTTPNVPLPRRFGRQQAWSKIASIYSPCRSQSRDGESVGWRYRVFLAGRRRGVARWTTARSTA